MLLNKHQLKPLWKKIEDELPKNHAAHCVEEAIGEGDANAQREKFTELVDLMGKYRS